MARKQRQTAPDLYSARCAECGEYLVQTESGFLCCPKGHGRLQLDDQRDPAPADEPCANLFGD